MGRIRTALSGMIALAMLAAAPARSASVPPGHSEKFMPSCDGVDDTAAIQRAFNALKSYQALRLPAGTCAISMSVRLRGKANVAVLGVGKDAARLACDDLEQIYWLAMRFS